jgi:hypothetical protein
MLVAALVLAALLAGPALASAAKTTAATTTVPASALYPQQLGSNGLSGGLPVTPSGTTPTTGAVAPAVLPTATTASTSGGGLGGGGAILVGLGAVALLGGVVAYIWRDSRRHAPVKPGGYTAAEALGGGRSGSKAPPKSRKLSAAERKRRKRGRAR